MIRRPSASLPCFFLILACGAAGSAGGETRVEGSLAPSSVEVGEAAALTIHIEGAGSIEGEPDLTAPEGVRIRGGGESRSFSLMNGRFAQSLEKQYLVVPLREGEFTIGPFDVKVSGRLYRIGPFPLSAAKGGATPGVPPTRGGGQTPRGGAGPAPGAAGTPPLTLTASATPSDVYVGQQLLLTLSFLRRADTRVIGARFAPLELEGFWKEELPPERHATRRLGNAAYEANELLFALFPTRPGELTIPPAKIDVQYRDPDARSRNDPFAIFGFGGREKEEELSGPPIAVHVRPLPPGAPAEFTGAVGSYEIRGRTDRAAAVQGEPLTWTIEIEGEGNISAIQGPRFPEIPGCRGYDAGGDVNTRRTNDRIGGVKSFARVLVPESAGVLELPRLAWAYFDPRDGRYRTLGTEARRIQVAAAQAAGGGEGTAGRLGSAIRGIRTESRLVPQAAERPWTLVSFWVLQAVPTAALLAGFAVRRARERRAKDPAGTKMRMAPRRLRESLRLVEMERVDPWGRLIHAVEGFLADRYGPEVRGLTREALAGFLEERGAAPEIAARMAGLLARADALRYTPAAGASGTEIGGAVRDVAECAAHLGRRIRA